MLYFQNLQLLLLQDPHHVRFELVQEQLLLPELHNMEFEVIQEHLHVVHHACCIHVVHHAGSVVVRSNFFSSRNCIMLPGLKQSKKRFFSSLNCILQWLTHCALKIMVRVMWRSKSKRLIRKLASKLTEQTKSAARGSSALPNSNRGLGKPYDARA